MQEQVVYVDINGNPTGQTEEKQAAHNAETRLHSAFSVYVFNKNGQLLVTRRALSKKVWPGVWTNTCCGHPMPGESREDAVHRRLNYELGMKVKNLELKIPKYIYKTPPFRGVIEHEFCPIYFAQIDSEIDPNPAEVEDYKWIDWPDFVSQTSKDGDDYSDPDSEDAPIWSWWCKDQLNHLIKIV